MQKSALPRTAGILRKVLERREYSVSVWSFVMTHLTEEMTVIAVIATARTINVKNK